MTKVELITLAERWQTKADRAMERYQEDGLAQIDEAASIWLSGWDAATLMLTGGNDRDN